MINEQFREDQCFLDNAIAASSSRQKQQFQLKEESKKQCLTTTNYHKQFALKHQMARKGGQQINPVYRKKNLSSVVYLQGKNTKTLNDYKHF